MELSGIRALPIAPESTASTMNRPTGAQDIARAFGNVLENALQSVEQQEQQVRSLSNQFMTGQLSDVHSLVIASEKAHLGLQLTVQVRNKVIEAYQEIMRTQL